MDMSFAIQLLSARYLVRNRGKIPATVITVPEEIDKYVADKKLESWGMNIDKLTIEQENYLNE
jgi:adenosylhomocysteinase